MKNFEERINFCQLSQPQWQSKLSIKASNLINNFVERRVTRQAVIKEIDSLDGLERDFFRAELNRYFSMKKGR